MQFHRATVRTQLTLAFGLLVAAVLAVSVLAFQALSDANSRFKSHVEQVSARESSTNLILSAIKDRSLDIYGLVLVSEAADIEAGKKQVALAEQISDGALEKLRQAIAHNPDVTDADRNLVAEIVKSEAAYTPIANSIVALALAEKKAEAIDRMNRELRPQLTRLLDATTHYLKYSQQRAVDSVNESGRVFRTTQLILAGAGLFALTLAVLLGLAITRSLLLALGAEPVVLGHVVQRIAGGDLSQVAGAAKAAEGSVLAAIARMQEQLHRLVSQVASSAQSIASASSEITFANEDLSRRTEAQAASLEQTSASMEQLTATVKHNADNARQGNLMATGASAVAIRGGNVVQRVVATMHDIAESSSKVTQIITVIESIAFQTNILALNAAVEAARAGEQGRGFAVVAGEVRILAQRSASAAKEIKDLIGQSVDRVNVGSQQVDEAGSTMKEVVEAVQRVNDLMAEITLATAEQHTGIEQVNKAVVQMDDATQQNAALVEQSAAAAESLKQQAGVLLQEISAFDVSNAGETDRSVSANR
ncbi:methyl-accepting chemotaxis protein [Acerihabitans sp. TG2]|uniref:methyl-accepting chemotaxis protein n=1 Tax=Acerihabitans sp. TG2 TaxID=3096008 RepID=UPI002B229840|nr:methyl-accepting chemotaxis protein [Acerihabitans sp. TG2]MEA9391611.1 methyl-accepting chemotaxis protein [Acerihabitans sp. TG2]